MESVDDLVIVVDDILPFLANVYLYKKGMTQTRMSEQHVNVLLSTKGNGDLKSNTIAAWETVGAMR